MSSSSGSHILLTPGPCATSETVRQAAALPDLNHRDPEYLNLIRDVKCGLRSVAANDDWVPYLIGGSGTAAMEAMVTSCAPRESEREGTSLILENGYYSERMAELFQVHKLPSRSLSFGWLGGYDFNKIEQEIRNGVRAVFATQHETTTGRLNDLTSLADLCASNNVPLYVDAMSSFGADPLPEGISGFCSSANKCLHGLPGVSFVMLQGHEAAAIREREPLSYYLHLARYEGENPPLTPPVIGLQALRQALREYPGQANRRETYLAKVKKMELALAAIGCAPLFPASIRSSALLVAKVPHGLRFPEWFAKNYAAGFVIYGCKGKLAQDWFQVSPMGETTMLQIEAWCRFVRDQA